jgi:hypothetical protein
MRQRAEKAILVAHDQGASVDPARYRHRRRDPHPARVPPALRLEARGLRLEEGLAFPVKSSRHAKKIGGGRSEYKRRVSDASGVIGTSWPTPNP